MQRKAKTTEDRLGPIPKRLEILMSDDDVYVRKCRGPYVVAYLAFTYPRLVIPWLKAQAGSSDLNVRANVAKAFSQSLGSRRPRDGVSILNTLAKDDRRRVRQAVLSSARNILRKSGRHKSALPRRLLDLLSMGDRTASAR
jgi:hypothetical protein